MNYWVIPEEMGKFDKRTIEAGTPGVELMERAGAAAADMAIEMVGSQQDPVIVFAGPGNNGGDGLVLARKLREKSVYAHVVLAQPPDKELSSDCSTNLDRFVNDGGVVIPVDEMERLPNRASLVVDSILGTGFRGSVDGVLAKCMIRMASYDCPVLAVDTPSGINGRTAETDPLALKADVTVTFAAPKAGLLFPPGCGYTGSVIVADIGIEIDKMDNRATAGLSHVHGLLPKRPVDAHKGTFGRLLLIGGSERMPGAPQLMAMGALRGGAGLVTLAVPLAAHQLIAGKIPECLSSYFLPGDPSSIPDPSGFTAAAVGPGMGNTSSTAKIVNYILSNWNIPLVMDADALNVANTTALSRYNAPLIITPHPGEMARLSHCRPESISSRSSAAKRLAESTGVTVILKGRPTLVFHPGHGSCLLSVGNSGMATGGSGDVLTGIVASLLAQGSSDWDASILGVYLHGLAADIAIEGGSGRSLVADDIASSLGRAYRVIENGRNSRLLTSGGRWNGELND